jgi:hypothetical protein
VNILRKSVDEHLRGIVVPVLRQLGFKGAYPNFHRDTNGHVDLACFQFSQSGGKFVVELSYATPKRENVYANADVPVSKLRVSQTTDRFRLGSSQPHSDHWFDFANSSSSVEQICEHVASLVRTQGEAWWAHKRGGA